MQLTQKKLSMALRIQGGPGDGGGSGFTEGCYSPSSLTFMSLHFVPEARDPTWLSRWGWLSMAHQIANTKISRYLSPE